MPLFHLALVFAKRNIPHPMQAVFDAPVATPTAEQKCRIGLAGRKTADGVLDFDRDPTLLHFLKKRP
jgi:hypothetical protein